MTYEVEPPSVDLSEEDFRRLGYRLVDRIAEHLASLPSKHVTAAVSSADVQRRLPEGGRLPDAGADPDELLDDVATQLFDQSLFNGHPRFFGYITSSASPIGILGDLLASAVNANVGAWKLSPVATEMERQTVAWIADLVGFPRTGSGLLVSGGNMANIVCLMAARRAQAHWDVRGARYGRCGSRPARVRIDRDAYLDPEGGRIFPEWAATRSTGWRLTPISGSVSTRYDRLSRAIWLTAINQ